MGLSWIAGAKGQPNDSGGCEMRQQWCRQSSSGGKTDGHGKGMNVMVIA